MLIVVSNPLHSALMGRLKESQKRDGNVCPNAQVLWRGKLYTYFGIGAAAGFWTDAGKDAVARVIRLAGGSKAAHIGLSEEQRQLWDSLQPHLNDKQPMI